MKKINIALYGLRGFGNNLLEEVVAAKNTNIVKYYSRKEKYPFIYYDTPSLEDECKFYNVDYEIIPEKGDWIAVKADLAIISSFHRIFKQEHICKYKYAINIHPSILPSYKGGTPTTWSILNGEPIVGITAHFVNEKIDSGKIIYQENLLNPYLNDNELRRSLAFLSKKIINNILDDYPFYNELKTPKIKGSSFRLRNENDAIKSIQDFESVFELINFIKAFTNYPMPKIIYNNKIFVIDFFKSKEIICVEINKQEINLLGYWESIDK